LRVRAQHAAVLRRAETLAAQTGRVADLPGSDPLDDATVLVTGRGGSYPSLAVAVGERVGLVGALSIETAMRYLDAREIDGIVIGEGFSAQMVAGLLTVLAADARFRDLPLALTCGKVQVVPFQHALANLERIEEGPARLLEWLLPLVRLRAFESRLKRVLRAFDAQGMLDAESGLMTEAAFWPELARAVSEAQRRGSGLCIARFVFDSRLDRRTSLDAARLISRIVRNIDFGHRQADGAVLVVFTETELRAAHLVARRIAGSLRRTMRVSERDPRRSEPAVTLATLKASDTLDTLIARIGARAVAVA
jgi:GGDEF domain-containing protein